MLEQKRRQKYQVRFVSLCDGPDHYVNVITENEELALARAIKKLFGSDCGWHRNNAFSFGNYGQVVQELDSNQYSCVTDQIRIDIVLTKKEK